MGFNPGGQGMNWKQESLALIFGMLIVLIIFGDATSFRGVGNLDNIFGPALWPWTDVIYPLASIVVFLLYGKSRGNLRINAAAVLAFLALLAGLLIIQFDDIFELAHHRITLPGVYWTAARFCYLVVSIASFLAFGRACRKSRSGSSF
jgi:hypothetical protein